MPTLRHPTPAATGGRNCIRNRVRTIGRLAATLALLASPLAQAYFVRPYVQLGAVVQDGLQIDGATQAQRHIGDAVVVDVDLAEGTVRSLLEVAGPGGFGQAAGVLGDRLNILGAGGTTLQFNFGLDGLVQTVGDAVQGETLQIGVLATLRVFDVSAGATPTNFNTRAGALVSDDRFLQFDNPGAPLEEMVQDALSGSFQVASNTPLNLDVFASVSLFVATNANPVTVRMDFQHTATLALVAAPEVVVMSQSGVFPGSVSAVPEPQSWALLLAGGAVLAGLARPGRQARPR